jgi:hypothetical protein
MKSGILSGRVVSMQISGKRGVDPGLVDGISTLHTTAANGRFNVALIGMFVLKMVM